MSVCEAFYELASLVERSGITNIKEQFPDCMEFKAGEFSLSFNGQSVERKNSEGIAVPPFNCFVKANGWPLGVFGLTGGALMSSGRDESTEALIIEALKNTKFITPPGERP